MGCTTSTKKTKQNAKVPKTKEIEVESPQIHVDLEGKIQMVLKHALKDVDDEFGCFIEDDELDIPNFSLYNLEPKSAKK